MKKKTNPNKANQYKPDPRQSKFLSNFLDPNSETFSNAKQSAIKAGYTEKYAENITNILPSWLSDTIEDRSLVKKAIDNFNKLLSSKNEKILLDTSKFIAERLAKDKFSKREEVDHTSKGESLNKHFHKEDEKAVKEFHEKLRKQREERIKKQIV